MNVRAFTEADHELLARNIDPQRGVYAPGACDGLKEAGPAVTLTDDDGTPVVSAGVVLLPDHVGWAWFYCDPQRTKAHLREVVRTLRALVTLTMSHYQLRRVYAEVLNTYLVGHRWITFFGFTADGTRKEFTRYVRS
jgi:hypothetical protein